MAINLNMIALWILAVATVVAFSVYVLPAIIHIIKDGNALLSWRHRFSMHAWIVVFWFFNMVVFWLSMKSATGKGLLTTLAGLIITAQFALMFLGISFIARYNWNSPIIDVDRNRLSWAIALTSFISANILALAHSWVEFPTWQHGVCMDVNELWRDGVLRLHSRPNTAPGYIEASSDGFFSGHGLWDR